MEAKLVQNEPARLKKWQDAKLYEQILADRAKSGKGKWILHDGPPFANGDIHIGHLINKTLKDVIIRFRTMQGYESPYVPGWDCHGLPIEHKIQEKLKGKLREMATVDVRKECFAYAEHYSKVQSEQFQRLGILGDWANPYLTMLPAYEASTLEVFARFVEAGLVYKQLKPVHWSIANQTALADAELEYKDVDDQSVFVEFPVANPGAFKGKYDLRLNAKVSFLIWTTTPWTLPANMAIAVHPDVKYALVKYKRNEDWHVSVIASELVEKVTMDRVADVEVVKTVAGKDLVGEEYRHPFMERTSKVVHAEYVTTTDGTGLVHTAPGHGEDDYHTGVNHGIEIYCPVLADGKFDATVPEWIQGQKVFAANPIVIEKLKELGVLFAKETIRHSYPHDWRSGTPTIFRATEQWFICIDKAYGDGKTVRQQAVEAAGKKIEFVPAWGQNRLHGMLEGRPDWCISRQRAWGLPIPVFYNEAGEALLTPESVRAVAKRFGEKGSDAWFTDSPAELLGSFDPGPKFPKDKLRKEKDIFDVWFESGSSWNAVLRNAEGRDAWKDLHYPADLYLEGSDQHRGWFQLSLLPSLGAMGQPPYKAVLTHGFVVKPDGTKVSKKDKEYVTATQEIDRYGADFLRLWTSSVDYQGDIPTSPEMLKLFGDKYRKIRNTLRYLMSNLYDFSPAEAQPVPPASLDGWASAELDQLIRDVTEAYDKYQLHRVFRLLHDFCAVQISAVYGNAMKDRLYCDVPNSPGRRRCQTVMHRMAVAITKLLAPILVFTADEAWEHLQHKPKDEAGYPSVHLARLPVPANDPASDEQKLEWKQLMELRDAALLQLDNLKKTVGLNKAGEAEVVYPAKLKPMFEKYGEDMADLAGAGYHRFEDGEQLQVIDTRQKYAACARSWKRRPDVGTIPEFPDLSARDAAAVRARS
jgi:isoleucyl-tRNA synthetase